MYVALRHMIEQLPSGQVVNLMPGDAVRTFGAWPYQNKVAALNSRMVAKVETGSTADANALLAEPVDPRVKAQLDAEHGWHMRARMPLLPPDRQPPQAPAAPAVKAAVQVAQETPQDAADALLAEEDPELAEALGLAVPKQACDVCNFTTSSAQGLKIHKSRVHKAD